jgi:adenylate cyclase
MSADPENEFFSDGITEEIINSLTKIEALSVAARTSSFAFKGKNENVTEIGRKLKVGNILEGSVRKAGNRLRVTAQLIKVADGYHLWSERYDRQLEDVFAVQDEIAEAIARELRVRLTEVEKLGRVKAPTSDIRAYEHYLRGRQRLHEFRKPSLEAARRMFDRAIEIDPEYALAYAGIADCCSFLYMYYDASRANLESAEASSRRALELDPGSAEAHASAGLALSLTRQFAESEREFEQAVQLNPRLFEAHYFYARALVVQGKYEQALSRYDLAAAVRPDDYQSVALTIQLYLSLGREAEKQDAITRTIEAVYRHLDLYPDDARALYLGSGALIQAGRPKEGEALARRALAVDPTDPSILYNVGCCFALLGETDDALRCVEQAVEHGFGQREWFEHDGELDSLRQLPRFQALLQRMAG